MEKKITLYLGQVDSDVHLKMQRTCGEKSSN